MEQSITKVIMSLARKSQMSIGDLLKKYDLTASEEPFFMALGNAEGITQEELTAMVGVDKAVTTRVMKSLEEKGFITREQDERDRRANCIYPTRKIKEMRDAVHSDLLRFNQQMTNGISKENLELLYELLIYMEQNVSSYLNETRKRADET